MNGAEVGCPITTRDATELYMLRAVLKTTAHCDCVLLEQVAYPMQDPQAWLFHKLLLAILK
jgi:hypothetical protein